MSPIPLALAAAVAAALLAAEADAQSRYSLSSPSGGPLSAQPRYSLFPREGCSPTSRINPCGSRILPVPVGEPTDGPLTDPFRTGPLDAKPDPLGPDAKLPQPPAIESQKLRSQED